MTIDIRPPATRAELEACFPVMRQLRPHLTNAVKLAERVKRQAAEAYRLLAAWRGDAVVDLAGYRMPETCSTAASATWMISWSKLQSDATGSAPGCWTRWRLTLDTTLDNLLGQRVYFRYGMLPASLRFGMALD